MGSAVPLCVGAWWQGGIGVYAFGVFNGAIGREGAGEVGQGGVGLALLSAVTLDASVAAAVH